MTADFAHRRLLRQAHLRESIALDPVSSRLLEATSDRSEAFETLDDRLVAAAAKSGGDARFAACLYRAARHLQMLRVPEARGVWEEARSLNLAARHPRLVWWFHQTEGDLLVREGSAPDGFASFQEAADVAHSTPGMDAEWERSVGNLLDALRQSGRAYEVSDTFLRYLREKWTTSLGPIFYQISSDTLHWLGESELAYVFRSQAMKTIAPSGGRLARDLRELARYCVATGRTVEAAEHLDRIESISGYSKSLEELIQEFNVVTELFAARGEIGRACSSQRTLRQLQPDPSQWAQSTFAITKELLKHGEFEQIAELLEPIPIERVRHDLRCGLYRMHAEVAQAAGDLVVARELFSQALGQVRSCQASTATLAKIREELAVWVGASELSDVSEQEKAVTFQSRWLAAAARDIRRSLSASFLALEDATDGQSRLRALECSIDELHLLSLFLSDVHERASPTSFGGEFRDAFEAVQRLITRRGASLSVQDDAIPVAGMAEAGLAGRVAFGLVALISDHADGATVVNLRVTPVVIAIEVQGLTERRSARIATSLDVLFGGDLADDRDVPDRASFVSTLAKAVARGWTFEFETPEPNTVMITVDMSQGPALQEPTGRATPLPESELVHAAESDHPELVEEIRRLHASRFDGPTPEPSLLNRCRATGNEHLLASALLVLAEHALFEGNVAAADGHVSELRALIEGNAEIEGCLVPAAWLLHSCEYLVAEARGDGRARWVTGARAVIARVQSDDRTGSAWQDAIYNWALAELDRGGLASAWQASSLCDPFGTSVVGRSLELGVAVQVLTAEGTFAEAEFLGVERLSLGAATDLHQRQESLLALIQLGVRTRRFESALAMLDDLERNPSLQTHHQDEGLRAMLALATGDEEAAARACARVRGRLPEEFNALALSKTVPVEAALHLRGGRVGEARRTLESFPRAKHSLLDFDARLTVEDELAKATGDDAARVEIVRYRLLLAAGQGRFDVTNEPEYASVNSLLWSRDLYWPAVDKEKEAVATAIAHDLRNSVSIIMLELGLVALRPSAELGPAVRASLEEMATLADQLLDVAHLRSLKRREFDTIDVARFLPEVQQAHKTVHEERGGRFRTEVDLPPHTTVCIDRKMLETILRNLLGNAIKHGATRGTIRLVARHQSAGQNDAYRSVVTISVIDDGPGLDEARLSLFDPLVERPIQAGERFGLWIVQRYVRALGLQIRVSQPAGGGARFDVEIPVGSAISDA